VEKFRGEAKEQINKQIRESGGKPGQGEKGGKPKSLVLGPGGPGNRTHRKYAPIDSKPEGTESGRVPCK